MTHTPEEIAAMIERSSLGTRAAKSLRQRTSAEDAQRAVDRADPLPAEDVVWKYLGSPPVVQRSRGMTDPIATFLSAVREAALANRQELAVPKSKLKAEIAEVLKREGFIADVRIDESDGSTAPSLVVTFKYGAGHPAITGLERVSKPGLRVYAKTGHLPKVLGGRGVAILSTRFGVLTDREAEAEGVGGEVLAYVW